MTDQSKIPLPGKEPGKSLFERADGMFGTEGFSPAPVPRNLDAPVNRQPVNRQPAKPADMPQAIATDPIKQPASPGAEPELAAREIATIVFNSPVQSVDRQALARNGLIQPEGQITALVEEFRIVKRRVFEAIKQARKQGSDARARRVLVTSPLPEEGKSFCAMNLAISLAAEKGCEVLLVDADVAKPSVLGALGLPDGPGFLDVVADSSVRLQDCIITTDIPGLHVLPAGSHTNADSEFLASERTLEVLDLLTVGSPNRIVVLDSPPALAASPAAELARIVGQTIVIARADRTGQSAMEDALTLLSACPDIKLLLNAAHFSPSGRRFGAYYGQEA